MRLAWRSAQHAPTPITLSRNQKTSDGCAPTAAVGVPPSTGIRLVVKKAGDGRVEIGLLGHHPEADPALLKGGEVFPGAVGLAPDHLAPRLERVNSQTDGAARGRSGQG